MDITKQIYKQIEQLDKKIKGFEAKAREMKKEKAHLLKALKHLDTATMKPKDQGKE